MALIGLVGEVSPHDAQACHTLPLAHDVGADGGIEQAIGRRGGLGVVGTIEVVLLEVVVHTQRDEGVVQDATVMQDFPLDIGLPTRCRRKGQVLGFLGLVQLHGIDQGETGTQMQEVPWMDIQREFTTQQLSVTTVVAIGHELVVDDLARTVDEDVVVDAVAEQ